METTFRSVPKALAWADLIDRFAEALATTRLAQASVDAYVADTRAFAAWLARRGRGPTRATPDDVRAYLDARRAEDMTPATLARGLAALRRFYAWLIAARGLDGDPTTEISMPRRKSHPTHAAQAVEVDRLLVAIAADTTWRGTRDIAAVRLMADAGLAVHEVVALRVRHVDVALGKVTVEDRSVWLDPPVRDALAAWLDRRARLREPSTDHVFVSAQDNEPGLTRQGLWKSLRKHATLAGLDARNVSPRALRMGRASALLRSGARPIAVASALGLSEAYRLRSLVHDSPTSAAGT
jgi:integrase/recombinase XerD